jgi:hypothetical protein
MVKEILRNLQILTADALNQIISAETRVKDFVMLLMDALEVTVSEGRWKVTLGSLPAKLTTRRRKLSRYDHPRDVTSHR